MCVCMYVCVCGVLVCIWEVICRQWSVSIGGHESVAKCIHVNAL